MYSNLRTDSSTNKEEFLNPEFDIHMENSFMGLQQNPYISSLLNQKGSKRFDFSHQKPSISIPQEPVVSIQDPDSFDLTTPKPDTAEPLLAPPKPSNLRVSTMTAVCNIDVSVDLQKLYTHIQFSETEEFPKVKSCQFGSMDIKGHITTAKQKRLKDKKPTKKKNCFQNQATLVVALSPTRQINLKIFRNGKVQMTGLKAEEEGLAACQGLISKLTKMHQEFPDITVFNKTPINITDFSIVLINSDFSAGFRVKRENLYDLLFHKGIFVSYEPDIYPGVNAKYYWNTTNPHSDGICRCKKTCNGKGDGSGDGQCKKITIATFQSGNVIITGARNTQQTEDAYQFINSLFKNHYNQILRVSSKEDDSMTSPTKNGKDQVVVKIPIQKIVNYNLRKNLLAHKF